jgi:hypothetical protein
MHRKFIYFPNVSHPLPPSIELGSLPNANIHKGLRVLLNGIKLWKLPTTVQTFKPTFLRDGFVVRLIDARVTFDTLRAGSRDMRGAVLSRDPVDAIHTLLYYLIQFVGHASQGPKSTNNFAPVTGHRG